MTNIDHCRILIQLAAEEPVSVGSNYPPNSCASLFFSLMVTSNVGIGDAGIHYMLAIQ